jgi:rRNA maturation endonuclease Nob1
MAEQPCYCIDTSALIELHATYGSDVFVSLWQNLTGLVKEGRLIAPREVLREIEKKDNDLLKWVKKHRKMFREQDIEQLQHAQDILSRFSKLIDPAKEIPDADPFVVALAIIENTKRQDSLFKGQCIVVTQEKPSRGARPKIPDVCQHYGIECIPVAELFRKEGWKF